MKIRVILPFLPSFLQYNIKNNYLISNKLLIILLSSFFFVLLQAKFKEIKKHLCHMMNI